MSTSTAPTFATTLARLRTARRLNHRQLADASGLDHTYISRLERGNREPSRETVLVLAGALGLGDHDCGALLRAAGFWPTSPWAAFALAAEEAFPDGATATIGGSALLPAVTITVGTTRDTTPTGGPS